MVGQIAGQLASGLREGVAMFWETLWALVVGFTLSGAVQAFVSRGEMERVLGRPGVPSVARATLFGAASSSCSYAAAAMAKSLIAKGADFIAAIVFMIASTNLVVELGVVIAVLIGWQFTLSEFVGGLMMIVLFSAIGRSVFTPAVVDAVRRRLDSGSSAHHHQGGHASAPHEEAPSLPLSKRLRSLAGWSDAATYAIADATMLRREMIVGFGVAGFLAVLVPDSVWRSLFVVGHGFWSSLESVVVGPFIAIISFVCSIGNVPLAAVLWKGGISFGGVVSFIFADLITFPLLLVYRRYYGWALTLRLLAVMWLVMSLGGLAVEGLFSALGLVPHTRPVDLPQGTIGWNATTVLDVVALFVWGLLWFLAHNRQRFGGGVGYAVDPVCGMQVEVANAPAQMTVASTTYSFCSEHCRDRFAASRAEATSTSATAPGSEPTTFGSHHR